MNRALMISAVGEIATGLLLVIAPVWIGQLLLGAEVSGLAVNVARVAGLALIGLGLAAWPGPPLLGMVAYCLLITLFLAWLGISGAASGILLWPVVAIHAVLGVIMCRDLLQQSGSRT